MGVLRARVGGQWVDISSNISDVVWVDTDPPTDQATELWYDTDAVGPGSAAMVSGRNLLDNGQMAVKQRAVTTMAGSGRLADRWTMSNVGVGTSAVYYTTLTNFGPTPPAGRPLPGNIQFVQMTVAEAAAALSPNDYMQWAQNIEGQFLQHLNWGTPNALPLTYSFDIYSNIATTYVAELYRLETTGRSVSRLLPVPAGWSTQVVTFPGDTVTPITNDNAARLQAAINLAGGSAFTSGGVLQTTWGTTANNRWVGISNVMQATANNLVAVTNTQLEVGTVATPYEVRRWDDELAHCMRYFQQLPANNFYGQMYATTGGHIQSCLPVVMRVAPTAIIASAPWTNWINNLYIAAATPSVFALQMSFPTQVSFYFSIPATTMYSMVRGEWPAGAVDLSAEI